MSSSCISKHSFPYHHPQTAHTLVLWYNSYCFLSSILDISSFLETEEYFRIKLIYFLKCLPSFCFLYRPKTLGCLNEDAVSFACCPSIWKERKFPEDSIVPHSRGGGRGVGIGGRLERGQMGLESLCKRLNRVYRKVLKYNNLVLMNSFRGNK